MSKTKKLIFKRKIIEVKNLCKQYKNLIAVNKISFYVEKNTVFGILGENGAGKTTTLEMIEGLRKPNSGSIKIFGYNALNDSSKIKEKIGVQLQSSAYYKFLTLREILLLFGSFYQTYKDPIKLLQMVGLENKANTFIEKLSGGQKQRFSIVASLVNNPELVFLDEPTTGLDPLARRNLWKLITEINNQGKTIVLTTHYLEEAETFCDRIALMDKRSIIAINETHKLIEKAENPFKVKFLVKKISRVAFSKLVKLGEMQNIVSKQTEFELKCQNQDKLNQALKIINLLSPLQLSVSRATLEDVFIQMTGKTIENNGESEKAND